MPDLQLLAPSKEAAALMHELQALLELEGLTSEIVDCPRDGDQMLSLAIKKLCGRADATVVCAIGTDDDERAGVRALMRATRHVSCVAFMRPSTCRSEWITRPKMPDGNANPLNVLVSILVENPVDRCNGAMFQLLESSHIVRVNGAGLKPPLLAAVAPLIAHAIRHQQCRKVPDIERR